MKEYTVKEHEDGSISHIDKNNNEIYYKSSNGYEIWREYDENNNLIHYKDSNGYESWREYDKNNNEIYYKDSDGYEFWQEYDENGNEIHYTDSDGREFFYINDKEVSKEQWEKHYNKTNKIVIEGKEYYISSEKLKIVEILVKDIP